VSKGFDLPTPETLKTLQDAELDHIILRLAEFTGTCGRERSDRPKRARGEVSGVVWKKK
jgi:hypothetical protein